MAGCLLLFRSPQIILSTGRYRRSDRWCIEGRFAHFNLTLLLPLLEERERCFSHQPIIDSSISASVLFSTEGVVTVVIHVIQIVGGKEGYPVNRSAP